MLSVKDPEGDGAGLEDGIGTGFMDGAGLQDSGEEEGTDVPDPMSSQALLQPSMNLFSVIRQSLSAQPPKATV